MRSWIAGLCGIWVAMAMLQGCGRKGPLYLPEKSGTVVTRQGQEAARADEAKQKTEEAEKPK